MMCRCVYCDGWYDAAVAMGGAGYGLCPRCRDLHAAPPPLPDPAVLTTADRAALAMALPADLRAALDAAALDEVPREALDDLLRAVTGGPGAVPGGLLYLQCHAYLFPEADDAVL